MKTWFTIAAVIVLNIALLFLALAPGFVTYAEVPPPAVTCSLCSNPEVQAALTHAAAVGRWQIQGGIVSSAWWVVALCLANVGIAAAALIVQRKKAGNAV